MDELVKLLKSFECHFNWKLDELNNELDTFVGVQDKVVVKNEEISGQPWRHIVLDSILCYEECKVSPTSTDQKIHECMMSIASDEDPFVKKHRVSFENVMYAFKSHVALLNSTLSKAQELAKKVIPFYELSSKEKAGVMGFKANVIMEYGKEGTKKALEFAREAVKYDPTEAEWHFIVGKVLQRIRNFSLIKTPSEEERESLEKAFEMSKAPHCAIFLSGCLWSVSSSIFYAIPLTNGWRRITPKESVEMDAINSRCVTLLKHAAEGNPDCPHNLIRVARGFYALPKEFRNLPYAQKLVDACLEKAPDNAMVNIVAAQIFNNLGENDKAIKYAKKAGELGAYGGYIRFFELQVDVKIKFDAEDLYKTILTKFCYPLDVGKTYLHATCFYLFIKNNHMTSFEYFKKALEVDCDLLEIIKNMYVRWIRDNVNLYDIMYNEAKLKVKSLAEEFGADDVNLKTPRYLVFKIAMVSPTSTDKPCDPCLVKRLIDNAKFCRPGRDRGRRRGSGSARGGGERGRRGRGSARGGDGRGRGGRGSARGGDGRGRGGRGSTRNIDGHGPGGERDGNQRGGYASVSISSNRSRGRSRSNSSERIIKVQSKKGNSYHEIKTDWKGSSDSLCSNSSCRSSDQEQEREVKRRLEFSARIRRSSEKNEKSLKPDSDTEDHSGSKSWRGGCTGWRGSRSSSQEKLDIAGLSPGPSRQHNGSGLRRDSFKKSSKSLDNWRLNRDEQQPFKRSTESLDGWRSTNQRRQDTRVSKNSWRETSNKGEPPVKPALPKFNLNSPQAKSTFDEIKRTTSNPSNIRRSDLVQAMLKNLTLEPSCGKPSNSTKKEGRIQPAKSSFANVPFILQPTSPITLENIRKEQLTRTDSKEVAQLRATIMEQIAVLNTNAKLNSSPGTSKEKTHASSLDTVSASLQRLHLSETSEADKNILPGADDVLTSFIRRKFISEKSDDLSSDESVDSDYDARS